VSAAVILADGSEWVGTAGTNGAGTELKPNHLIWIASITKTMTGAVILGLAAEGRLALDDPISRWLDPIENINSAITIRQLLNHTNGLGIRRYAYLGREQWGHSGGSPLGSSLMLYDPDTGVTVAVMMNQGRGAEHFLLAPRLLAIARGSWTNLSRRRSVRLLAGGTEEELLYAAEFEG
jgi:CubicO group peptidase (beta-lactamase class C family)